MTSFQRQLNLYGFHRLTIGDDRNGYYHPMLLRGRPFLAKRIKRTKVKGNGGVRAHPDPDSEPNFYSMPYVYRLSPTPKCYDFRSSSEDLNSNSSSSPATDALLTFLLEQKCSTKAVSTPFVLPSLLSEIHKERDYTLDLKSSHHPLESKFTSQSSFIDSAEIDFLEGQDYLNSVNPIFDQRGHNESSPPMEFVFLSTNTIGDGGEPNEIGNMLPHQAEKWRLDVTPNKVISSLYQEEHIFPIYREHTESSLMDNV